MTANPLPPLTPEEYEQLKADIALRGVIVPILLDARGNVIDGHHRRQIARELGEHVVCPEETLDCSEEEARDLAVVLNTHRRQLSPEGRREAVARLRELGRSVRQIAEAVGAPKSTVARDLEAVREDPATVPGGTVEPDRIVGADGRERPARRAEPVPGPEVIGGQPLAHAEPRPVDHLARTLARKPQGDTIYGTVTFWADQARELPDPEELVARVPPGPGHIAAFDAALTVLDAYVRRMQAAWPQRRAQLESEAA